jgi:hypothetical protein
LARRKHHSSSGRTLPLVLVTALLVTMVGAGAFVLLRRGGTGADAEERPVPEFSFQLGRIKSAAVGEPPRDPQVASTAEEVHAVLDRLYTIAFVDPGEWEGGRFPAISSLFGGPASRQAAEDLEDLSLGSAAPHIDRVQPRRSRLIVSLLYDDRAGAASAIAEATFRAVGRTMDGRRLHIDHEGRYLLRPSKDGWRIVAYRVDGALEASDPAGGSATR